MNVADKILLFHTVVKVGSFSQAATRIGMTNSVVSKHIAQLEQQLSHGHEVTAELDGGPVLGQARVPVMPGDTADMLAARVLVQEHKLYPAVLRRFSEWLAICALPLDIFSIWHDNTPNTDLED